MARDRRLSGTSDDCTPARITARARDDISRSGGRFCANSTLRIDDDGCGPVPPGFGASDRGRLCGRREPDSIGLRAYSIDEYQRHAAHEWRHQQPSALQRHGSGALCRRLLELLRQHVSPAAHAPHHDRLVIHPISPGCPGDARAYSCSPIRASHLPRLKSSLRHTAGGPFRLSSSRYSAGANRVRTTRRPHSAALCAVAYREITDDFV